MDAVKVIKKSGSPGAVPAVTAYVDEPLLPNPTDSDVDKTIVVDSNNDLVLSNGLPNLIRKEDGIGNLSIGRDITRVNNPEESLPRDCIIIGCKADNASDPPEAQGVMEIVIGKSAIVKATPGTDSSVNAIAIGTKAQAYGVGAMALGEEVSTAGEHKAVASHAVAIGVSSQALENHAYARGQQCKAKSRYSNAIGLRSETSSTKQTQWVIGRDNVVDDDALFLIGDGTSATDKHNAFAIKKNSSNVYSIQVGATTITEAQLIALLSLL